MKNADMPAMPTYELNGQNVLEDTSYGMTKREMFAMAAMQGFAANSDPQTAGLDIKEIANISVKQADALLKALENDA